ncbi:MAG TPA: FMN-binding negative transcriptional regulator [Granulicella sp.]|jgi:transcriptional regulator|nr:FMN-binding negative transcriptional regulator [Granulicella sp.]
MYIPQANEEKRIPILHQLIQAEPLAALVTLSGGGLLATHLPMVLEASADSLGTLRGHVSRANPQWRDLDSSVDALAIFSGPQHYITPNWYPGKQEHGKEVPTWNYVVVHAYGPLQVIADQHWLLTHIEQLTAQSEVDAPTPWRVSDAPAEFIRTLLNGIIGFELPIHRLEGKWKVSQNRSARDKQSVIDGLTARNTPEALTMKDLVAERS